MTYQEILIDKQAVIEDRIIGHAMKDPTILYGKDLFKDKLEALIASRMDRWILTATSRPNPLEDFDAVAFFVSQWIHNLYPTLRKEIFKSLKMEYSTIDWNSLEDLEDSINVGEDMVIEILKEKTIQANADFLKKLEGSDQKVFWSMLKGLSDEEKAKHVFPGQTYDKTLKEKVRYLTNLLEFKYGCFILTRRLYDEDLIIKTLNKAPKLLKRFLDMDERIVVRPSDEQLLQAAFSYSKTRNTKRVFQKEKWIKESKIDFNGKEHKHFVVYRAGDRLYDQVTQRTKNLIGGER